MMTQVLFTVIVIAMILQRLFELRLSQRHAAIILAKGGREHHSNALPWVKAMQIAWFAAMLAEVWGLHRPLIPVLAAIALLLTLLGQYLRYLSMQALGWRWTLTTMTVVGLPVVDTGIYRYLRHPSWLGVILEILGLPLIHGAYLTAIVFSVANAFLMVKRIQAEEQALSSESNYIEVLGDRPRFIPKVD